MAGKGIVQKFKSNAELEGLERVFGNKKPQRGSWVQDPKTGKLVPKDEYVRPEGSDKSVKLLEPFKSPITGETITCPKQLREHNRRHGVTDSRDYSPEHYKKKEAERNLRRSGAHPDDKAHRIEKLKQATEGKVRW